ncbi:MAG: hypothetical protein M1368_03275 [Thaumarchaeota archaeon]|nr:hypothetical protein [Nitrososphaerota archaeon]
MSASQSVWSFWLQELGTGADYLALLHGRRHPVQGAEYALDLLSVHRYAELPRHDGCHSSRSEGWSLLSYLLHSLHNRRIKTHFSCLWSVAVQLPRRSGVR